MIDIRAERKDVLIGIVYFTRVLATKILEIKATENVINSI